MHEPVMFSEAIEMLAVRPDAVYLDATCGLGGHTAGIAGHLTTGYVIAHDRDAESLALARGATGGLADRIRFVQGEFSTLTATLKQAGVERVDGLLADLGVSRFQLTQPARGLSFLSDGPLDMRMDQSKGSPAEEIVNYAAERELADLIYHFGEERRARKIARAIVRGRPVRSTLHLASVVEKTVPRTGRIHPATKTFMALRMAVNGEQEELDRLLEQAPHLVTSGGRIVVISFMSLEDRKVKQCFRLLGHEGRAAIVTKHPLTPTAEEVMRNPAARSAKLRAVEMN